jgi:hypothetical protein
LQNPYQAFVASVARRGINGGNITGLSDMEEFDTESNELVKDWNDVIKSKKVFAVLSESNYLPPDDEVDGHPYDNVHELSASTTNLAVSVPDAFGEQVGELPINEKTAVLVVIKNNVAKLKRLHAKDKTFCDWVEVKYELFLKSAGEPVPTS